MAKKYVCDICNRVIDDPYYAKMREYFISVEYDCGGLCPVGHKSFKHKVHLCGSCFEKLAEAAVKKKEV